jgi:ubiquinone/menaquinone biosynthesis C-methylase UbiE
MFLFNYSNLVDPLLRNIRDFTPAFAGMTAGDKVLDVCCGTGAQVIRYGLHGIEAIGIDNDPNMMKLASTNLMKSRLMNISFRLADATELPFPDNQFDYSSITFGLHDKDKTIRGRVIGEMKRVVKLNGKFIFVDFAVPLPKNMWGLFARVVEFLVGGEHYRGFKNYINNGGLSVILKEHNIREVQSIHCTGGLILTIKAAND